MLPGQLFFSPADQRQILSPSQERAKAEEARAAAEVGPTRLGMAWDWGGWAGVGWGVPLFDRLDLAGRVGGIWDVDCPNLDEHDQVLHCPSSISLLHTIAF